MKMAGGKFVLEWADGRKREIGTVDVDTEKIGAECRLKFRRIRIGWEFIRVGIKVWIRGFKHE